MGEDIRKTDDSQEPTLDAVLSDVLEEYQEALQALVAPKYREHKK